MRPFIIAIDGPAASGKGTLGRRLAQELDFAYLDTGRLYRAVAYHYERLQPNATSLDFEVVPQKAYEATQTIDPQFLNNPILSRNDIALVASKLAACKEVRDGLLAWQQDFCKNPGKDGAILDGRDIGTVVAPQADLKLFLLASSEERAKRRLRETLDRGEKSDYESILEQVRQRDKSDSCRELAPCRPAEDAVLVDTNRKDASEIFSECLVLVRLRMGE